MNVIDFISQPWHWSVSGAMIVVVMFFLIYLGQRFGVSTSFRALCSAAGGGKTCNYFDYNWKTHSWLLMFVIGSIIGGALASQYLASEYPVAISDRTVADLAQLGIQAPLSIDEGSGMVPTELFNFKTLQSFIGILLFIVGGFLIGFGTRWAGGCTSGHAITGLSNLQLPSLVAVIGFFIGGLAMTHLLFPVIFQQ